MVVASSHEASDAEFSDVRFDGSEGVSSGARRAASSDAFDRCSEGFSSDESFAELHGTSSSGCFDVSEADFDFGGSEVVSSGSQHGASSAGDFGEDHYEDVGCAPEANGSFSDVLAVSSAEQRGASSCRLDGSKFFC